MVQRQLTQGEKSDENMQPILWTERRTGAPASTGQRKQLAFLDISLTKTIYLSMGQHALVTNNLRIFCRVCKNYLTL